MKDYELAKISLEELLQPVMQEFTPEQIARTFPAEKLAKALTPEQLAKALTPEQLTEFLAALPPELREQIKRQLH